MLVSVLVLKLDGCFGPIGLMPLRPLIWTRARRNVTQECEQREIADHLDVDAAKGATVVARRQASRAGSPLQLPSSVAGHDQSC